MTDVLQVSTTAESREAALRLMQSAVAAKLAASGQVSGPIETAFRHLDELGAGEEWQVSLRTTRDRYDELEKHLVEQHPWDNPRGDLHSARRLLFDLSRLGEASGLRLAQMPIRSLWM